MSQEKKNSFVASFRTWKRDECLDIGLLEISRADAELLGGSFVDEIALDVPLDQEWKIVVCGYPGQMIGIKETQNALTLERTYDFRSMVFFSGTIPETEWPSKGFARSVVENAELFVHFSESAELEQVNFINAPPTLSDANLGYFKPAGMSGGGIWSDSRPTKDSTLWSPRPLLLAIQSSVNVKNGWLRGTRSLKWAELAGINTET